ncbi:terminase large subunit domain-containing protein [Paraburkholderia youngii]|uniref:terminase large subunit domain-containing protein n=1 Tax=Paraburkholderia youngii TaxID=2782701 RepID=UPI001591B555|nr:terminase family protein [Paraburkholderia youngii]NUX58672.1 DNA packaging protein [Paraburkholderia youngii]
MDLATLDLSTLTVAEKQELLDLLELKQQRKDQNKLADYAPYPKQMEFHAAGADPNVIDRLLMAGNQLGKTHSAGFETAMHLTGDYPDWWTGKRFDGPTLGWAAGVTGESTRDNPQRILLGQPGEWGTGSIPADRIIGITRKAHGVPDSVDSIKVRHKTGGTSIVWMKAYEQGREKWQGVTLHFLWCDEEPPEDIYAEGKTRTQAGDEGRGGITYITFTPLLGMSSVVRRFLLDKIPGTHVTNMTIDDALHYTETQRAQIIAGYLPHEREARARGIPTMGSGRVYPVPEDTIKVAPFAIPHHWPRIVGVDFGWDHPAAGAWLAWDRETDTIYVYDCYRQKEQTSIYHAAILKSRGAWIPVAWPVDGLQTRDGKQAKVLYQRAGANMLEKHAQDKNGGASLEATTLDMLERMQTGRFKVFAHLSDWWEEFRLYHRKDGVIQDINDDIMSATRYGTMMIRYAETAAPKREYIASFDALDSEAGY